MNKKYNIKDVTLFTDESLPNGTSTLYLVDQSGDVIDSLEEALFGAHTAYGANHGVYYETCGGYAGQIHTAAFLNYECNRVMYVSNLEQFDCNCDECQEKGYEASICECKDWTAIDDFNKSQLNCYISGLGRQEIHWHGDESFTIEFSAPLPSGRVRCNCTAPSLSEPGRFYWYSKPWFILKENGDWYPL